MRQVKIHLNFLIGKNTHLAINPNATFRAGIVRKTKCLAKLLRGSRLMYDFTRLGIERRAAKKTKTSRVHSVESDLKSFGGGTLPSEGHPLPSVYQMTFTASCI